MRRVSYRCSRQSSRGLGRALGMGLFLLAGPVLAAPPNVQYDFGNPTPDEQYMLELINRARANPNAEGSFLTNMAVVDPDVKRAVDLYSPTQPWVQPVRIRSDFNSYAARPPLAWNPRLQLAARSHAEDMAARNYQGHTFPPSNDPLVNREAIRHRIEDIYFYDWQTFGENVYASQDVTGGYARVPSIIFAHCGLQIDWTVPTLFHRSAIMALTDTAGNVYPVFREVGIGIVPTPRSTIAEPALATCTTFGIERKFPATTGEVRDVPFLTGVVYADGDQDFFYGKTEGRGGITVTPEHGKYFAVTNASGSYSLPLINLPPGVTTMKVNFSGGSLGSTVVQRDLVLSGTENRKVDLRVPVTGASRLANLSTRLRVEGGSNVGIAGFVVSGDQPKRFLIRVLGPTLEQFGVPGPLTNPRIQLNNSAGQQIGFNDDWQETQRTEISTSGFPPPNSLEPAILATLSPGSYTAIVSGSEARPNGVAIVEVYDLDSSPTDARAINVSTRGKVLVDAEVMIGGFVIDGTQPRQVVVRALGPTLTQFQVPGALQDPTLELFSGSTLVRANDNWRDDPGQATLTAKGLAPPDNREPAIVITLNPGAYTAIVRGVGGTTGVGIVEVYDLP